MCGYILPKRSLYHPGRSGSSSTYNYANLTTFFFSFLYFEAVSHFFLFFLLKINYVIYNRTSQVVVEKKKRARGEKNLGSIYNDYYNGQQLWCYILFSFSNFFFFLFRRLCIATATSIVYVRDCRSVTVNFLFRCSCARQSPKESPERKPLFFFFFFFVFFSPPPSLKKKFICEQSYEL